ncbi:DUF423 domain-containing protein [Candidatus Nitrospira bockiana]
MRRFSVLGAVFGFLGVVAGAFGAHSLKAVLSPEQLTVFETAVRYQMYHALALVLVGELGARASRTAWRQAGIAFAVGILLFSGSLYMLLLSGVRWLGAVTPLGGVAFLIGWALVGRACWNASSEER